MGVAQFKWTWGQRSCEIYGGELIRLGQTITLSSVFVYVVDKHYIKKKKNTQ